MSNDREPCSTARIAVAVTAFYEIGREVCRADIQLTDTGHGAVSQARINDPIVVHREAYLDFFVFAREGDRYTYSPVGISFKEVCDGGEVAERHEVGRDLLGHAAFPVRTFASRDRVMQLSIFDANPEPAEFKFDLVIQRSDGLLGIIDPPVKNKGRYT